MDITQAAPAKNRPTRFDDLFRQKLRCAVSIDDCPIIGNQFSPTLEWDVKVDLDPGVQGRPSLGLDFKFSKDGTYKNFKDHYNTFAVGWEPGVKIGGQWMMDQLHHCKAAYGKLSNISWPPALQTLCKKPEDIDRVCRILFKSNVHRSSKMTVNWAKHPRGNDWEAPYANLKRMYESEDPSYNVRIWFLSPVATFERLTEGTLAPLKNAVEDHTPPFYRYLDENDEPLIDFNALETIDQIGNGMYRKRPKVTDQKGKRVESMRNEFAYVNLPKITTWDSIKSFHITYGVPIVREAQYNEGLYAPRSKGLHGVFLQRMPVLKIDGQNLQPDRQMRHTFWAGVRLRRDPKTGLKDVVPPSHAPRILCG